MKLDLPFQLNNPWKFPLHGLPLRVSIPLPQGVVRDPRELCLVDEKGRDVGAQWQVLTTWKDGSARFALMNYAEPHLPPRTRRCYQLKRQTSRRATNPVWPVNPNPGNQGFLRRRYRPVALEVFKAALLVCGTDSLSRARMDRRRQTRRVCDGHEWPGLPCITRAISDLIQ